MLTTQLHIGLQIPNITQYRLVQDLVSGKPMDLFENSFSYKTILSPKRKHNYQVRTLQKNNTLYSVLPVVHLYSYASKIQVLAFFRKISLPIPLLQIIYIQLFNIFFKFFLILVTNPSSHYLMSSYSPQPFTHYPFLREDKSSHRKSTKSGTPL